MRNLNIEQVTWNFRVHIARLTSINEIVEEHDADDKRCHENDKLPMIIGTN